MQKELRGNDVASGRAVMVKMDAGMISAVDTLGDAISGFPWVGAGLVDLQVNGHRGLDFNAPMSADEWERAAELIVRLGVTTFLPTVITGHPEKMVRLVRGIAKSSRDRSLVRSAVGGIHIEGPFISPYDGPRGAHDRQWVRPPDWGEVERLIDAGEGRVVLITMSPEWPEAPRFIERCRAAGLTVAIGHTAATSAQIREAVAAGASLSTHLGNGTFAQLPRHDNHVWEQLATDALWASFIGDGVHLPDPMLRAMLRAKRHKALLVSDAVAAAGDRPGIRRTAVGTQVVVSDDRIELASDPRFLAGSARTLPDAVGHLVSTGLANLRTAWAMASVRPARLLGLPVAAGLSVGAPADVVVFDVRQGVVMTDAVWKAGEEMVAQGGAT